LSMVLGVSMLAPMAVGFIYHEEAAKAFLIGAIFSMALGAMLYWLFRGKEPRELNHRDGLAIVGLAWAAAGILGGVPFFLSGDFASYTDCVFESISGFTTTGASILSNVEAASKATLFWRSLTHWLGGMGFVVLSIAILPFVGVGGMQLYRAEVPSPTPDKLRPRINDTASLLWKVYAGMTLLQMILLMFGGMNWFDAICHAMATLATGGFSTKNASVAAYTSPYIQWVITIFMVLAGINFTLHFYAVRRKFVDIWRDEEWRFYMALVMLATSGITLTLVMASDRGFWEALRLAAFQTATILTTTGFATEDFSLWPPFALAILVGLMFVGGSAGSTGGGPKCMRIMLVVKRSYLELNRLIHPRMMATVTMGGRVVDRSVVGSIWAFLGLYLICFLLTGVVLAAMGIDITTSFFASIACLGNIGPGLGEVGPAGNYAALPLAAKWVLSLAMLVGRLEIYTVLVLFLPEFWRN
jgi:trk system potassium uptake protein TrkH